MQSRIISTIIGLVLVGGVGSLVYATKRPYIMPSIDGTPQEGVNAGGSIQSSTDKASDVNVKARYDLENEDEEESEDGRVANPTVTPTTSTQPKPQPQTSSGITMTQISAHKSRTSCWSAINGNVYDLTSWIPNHPGGEQAILSLCGKDGSAGYNGQHGGQSKPTAVLAGFKIGVVAK